MPSVGHKAQRTCLGCRQVIEQSNLVRYVLSPAGQILVDYGRKLPGRGAYTHFDSGCLQAAVKKRQFERAFRSSCRVDGEALHAALAGQIRERILNLLGMARKAGQAVSGSGLVLAAVESAAPPVLILLAEDLSAGIGEKIVSRAEKTGIPCHRLFGKELLGQVLGKGERSVVALRDNPLAASIRTELLRYEHIVGES